MENKTLYPLALYLANDAREREFKAAARARLVTRVPRRSVRQAVGRSLVNVGARLAGDTQLELARSR